MSKNLTSDFLRFRWSLGAPLVLRDMQYYLVEQNAEKLYMLKCSLGEWEKNGIDAWTFTTLPCWPVLVVSSVSLVDMHLFRIAGAVLRFSSRNLLDVLFSSA